MEHKLLTVGLVDYLSPEEVLTESIATGVNLTHIKSVETFDVVFNVARLIAPNESSDHGFATTPMNDEFSAGIPSKVGFIHETGLHLETNYHLQNGDRIKINHHWLEKRIVPSLEVFIQNVATKNLFYHFKYAVDAEFLFVDDFLPPEGMDPKLVEKKRSEREELILYYKKQLRRWIADNFSRSVEKKAKVLIVDSKFHFYNDQPRTDKHDYTIRCLSHIDDPVTELDRLEPQVIAFAFDKEELTSKNNNESFVRLMKIIQEKFEDLNPFVIVFNCEKDSKVLQENFQYPHIIGTNSELTVDVLVKMADIFDKRLQLNFVINKDSPKRLFLNKTNIASIAEITIPIKIVKLSECDMVFQTEKELPTGINLHLTEPVNMYINVSPAKTQGKIPEYYGLIHCLGEVSKKELRHFVNSVFFRDHDAQHMAENEEFKKLNEVKLQEKLEAENKVEVTAEDSTNQDPSES
jgi:hypothetical protein